MRIPRSSLIVAGDRPRRCASAPAGGAGPLVAALAGLSAAAGSAGFGVTRAGGAGR